MTGFGLPDDRHLEPPSVCFQTLIEYDIMVHVVMADNELLKGVWGGKGMFILSLGNTFHEIP